MTAPRKPIKLNEIEEAPLGGGGSLTGDGVGFISTVPAGGDSSPEGAGDGAVPVEPEGGGDSVVVWLVLELLLLSANTITTTFSFLMQLSLLPLMK